MVATTTILVFCLALLLAFFVVLVWIAWQLGRIAGALGDKERIREAVRHLVSGAEEVA